MLNQQSNVSFPLIQNNVTKNKKKDEDSSTLDHLKAAVNVMSCSKLSTWCVALLLYIFRKKLIQKKEGDQMM
jgi:hypothetical protein